jgi:hypothetical protein
MVEFGSTLDGILAVLSEIFCGFSQNAQKNSRQYARQTAAATVIISSSSSIYHHAIRRCIICDTKSVVKYSPPQNLLWRIDPLLGKDIEINSETSAVAM